jgi:aspartate-semialdehyde dehydrogenase
MFNVAIVGATGLVGQNILEILEQRNFPIEKIFLLASSRSLGQKLSFKGTLVDVMNLDDFDFEKNKIKVAFFSAGSLVSLKYAERLGSIGCIVIDNTSCFRYRDDVPLIVPEINPEDLGLYKATNIIANPNCATIQALLVLKPIYDLVGINKIDFITYQSVSGTGRAAVAELIQQTASMLNGEDFQSRVYPKRIAFNILPHIDVFQDNGYTKEEMKMVWETHKIFHDNSIKITATNCRVPTLYGHCVVMHIVTKKPIKAKIIREELTNAPGVSVMDNPSDNIYPTVVDVIGRDDVIVGRIRNFINDDNGLAIWTVADNIRKGAALNAVQIAEMLLTRHMLK